MAVPLIDVVDKSFPTTSFWRKAFKPLSKPVWKLQVKPSLRIQSATLCRALLEVYLGNAAVIPEARAAWAKGAQVLMQNEEERRSSRKGGSG